MSSTVDTISTLDDHLVQSANEGQVGSLYNAWVLNHVSNWPTRNGMNSCDLDRLDRFRTRTASTIYINQAPMPTPDDLVQYAIDRNYLMHAILAVTAIHDEHLSSGSECFVQARTYHLNQAARLLNHRLSLPADEHDLGLIWATSMLLHRAVMAAIDHHEPLQAWPNCSYGSVDLDWFRFAYKTRVFTMRLERLNRLPRYGRTKAEAQNITTTVSMATARVRCLIDTLEDMCIESADPRDTKDPRLSLLHGLKPLILQPLHSDAFMLQLSPVLESLNVDFVEFLDRKDPLSLLLMGMLNAHLCSRDWWMARRAKVEGQAICSYLEMHHANIQPISECLWYPRLLLGLGS